MKWFASWIASGLTRVAQYLLAYGPLGLFTIALLDSAMVPLPGGTDAVIMLLAAARPGWTPLYVAAATIGSVVGCLILYYISRRAGQRALARFSPSKQQQVKDLINRYDVLSVLVASVLPPPFPFKLFVVTAGAFRLNVLRFASAVAAGRLFRFSLEGYLAARYGEQAKGLLARYYPAIGISVAVLLIGGVVVVNLLKRRRSAEAIEY